MKIEIGISLPINIPGLIRFGSIFFALANVYEAGILLITAGNIIIRATTTAAVTAYNALFFRIIFSSSGKYDYEFKV